MTSCRVPRVSSFPPRTGVGLVALATCTHWMAGPAVHAAVQEETAKPRVTLVQSVGPPGGAVAIPIRLAGVEGASLGTVTLRLRFQTSRLTFSKVEIGGLGEAAGVQATAQAQPRGRETLLEVTIATPEQNGARTPIPDGPIAQLVLTVAKDLKPKTVIPLKLEATGGGLRKDSGPVAVLARDGEIIVSNPPVIGCFFYMH